jgi:hypothetical protein
MTPSASLKNGSYEPLDMSPYLTVSVWNKTCM